MFVTGPANALSGLMCEYGESDEDSEGEDDTQTYHEESKSSQFCFSLGFDIGNHQMRYCESLVNGGGGRSHLTTATAAGWTWIEFFEAVNQTLHEDFK